MYQEQETRYFECRGCPFFLADRCLIEASRILLYFYCPASEGFRAEKVLPAIYKVTSETVPRPLVGSNNGTSSYARA